MFRLACAVGLAAVANMATASVYDLQLRDYALPGHVSDDRILEWCNPTNSYSVCGPGPSWIDQVVTSNDKELVLKIENLYTDNGTASYDRYVVFREKGSNPTIDDVMRVQFNVLGTPWGGDPNYTEAALTISLISGGLVPGYLTTLPGTAVKVGDYQNTVNQEFLFGNMDLVCDGITQICEGDVFSSWGGGPHFPGLPTIFSVIPTLVPEPSSVLLSGLGLAVLARRRNRR